MSALLLLLTASVVASPGLVYAQEKQWSELQGHAEAFEAGGNYQEALDAAKKALREAEKMGDKRRISLSLAISADMDAKLGHYSEAESLYERLFTIIKEMFAPDIPAGAATILNNLGGVRFLEGLYNEADKTYTLALKISIANHRQADQSAILTGMAAVYRAQGRYHDAETYYRQALDVDEKARDPDDPTIAEDLENLGSLYASLGMHTESEPLIKKALEIRETHPNADQAGLARNLGNLANLYILERKYPEAEELFNRAIAIVTNELGPESPEVAQLMNNLALLYGAQGSYDKSRALYARSLAIREKVLGPNHPDTTKGLIDAAATTFKAGQLAEAGVLYDRALHNMSVQFRDNFSYMSEQDKLQFVSSTNYVFSEFFSFGTSYADQDPSVIGKMYDLLLWEKGMVSRSVASLRGEILQSANKEIIQLFDDLAAKRNQSVRLAILRPIGWRQTKQAIDEEANDIERKLARRTSVFSEQENFTSLTWNDVQKTLRPGEVAVEAVRYYLYRGSEWTGSINYAFLVLTPQTVDKPFFIPLGDADSLKGAIRDYQGLIEETSVGFSQGNNSVPGQAFYRAFWKPLEPFLNGARTIFLSPDGVLDQVSLGVLPSEDGEILLSKYDIRIVPSTKDLLRTKQTYTNNTAVLIGNPKYDLSDDEYRVALVNLAAATQKSALPMVSRINTFGLRSEDSPTGPLASLPQTAVELDNIDALLRKQSQSWQVDIFRDHRALVEAVQRVHHPRVLYLATHGFFESDQSVQSDKSSVDGESSPAFEDPMVRSGLYFAGADRARQRKQIPKGLGDGVLTAYETSVLDLHGTEMVVLSACETGLGKFASGEGVFGLLRGFQEAGTDSVVISMWKVPDAQTQQLMTAFYENWLSKHLDKHEALRQAQLDLRCKVKDHFGQDLPYYWGAFVLVGR